MCSSGQVISTSSPEIVAAVPGGTVLFRPWYTEPCASCVGVANLTLSDDSCTDSESHEACVSITGGPNYGVYGPNGDLALSAKVIHFVDGFFVGIDGSLAAGEL